MTTKEFQARIRRIDRQDVDVEIGVALTYDVETDPFAVQAVFSIPGEDDRIWDFSRELLEKGARSLAAYGKGDVRFRYFPGSAAVMICLRTPEGHADVMLPKQEVDEFLAATAVEAAAVPEMCTALVDEFLKELFEA